MNTAKTHQENINIGKEIEKSFADNALKIKLTNYAYNLTESREDAEELVQQARCNVWKSKETLNWKNPTALLKTIIIRLFINDYRKKQIRPTINITQETYREVVTKQSAVNKAESSFAINTIQEAINKLKENSKEAIKLSIEGYKYKEIADILKIPIGTVKSRIFLAREELANALINIDPSYKELVKKK